MNDWKEEVIGNYIDLISGFAFKSNNFLSTKIEDSLPVIKIKNVAMHAQQSSSYQMVHKEPLAILLNGFCVKHPGSDGVAAMPGIFKEDRKQQ